MAIPAIHVTYHASEIAERRWHVVRAGITLSTHPTKQGAIDAGRRQAKTDSAELTVHNEDGTISAKDSHGHDPRNIPG
jgi:Uncharacterized protein conserved in bacteria (DUF2188)